MIIKATPKLIETIIEEEFGKMQSTEDAAKEVEEVDADEYADTLEKKVDMLKALKIEEQRLMKKLLKIKEQKLSIYKNLKK